MANLPTGIVTFLFTDVEGSTRLLQALGDRYADMHAAYARVVREAIASGDGVEISTEGDSFFAVFESPVEAVAAAVSAQRALAATQWPPGTTLTARMGLHTGVATLGADNYLGIEVHRAARVAAAAHGGQILLSAAVRGLVEDRLPADAWIRDLGEHRLKDIDRPERLADVVIEGLPDRFPPPRTLDARPNNLPAQLTSFVGRREEIADLRRMVARTRLLTLTGAGGSGKTRLALQVASEVLADYRDGAFFVDLSAVSDPALVPSAIARALGVIEAPGRPLLEVLMASLAESELLIVIDNFEQVIEAAFVVEQLLGAASRVKALVTSRIVLSLRGEQEYVVAPLEPPDPARATDLAAVRRSEAVQLFVERARDVRPQFEVTERNGTAVAEITARLDGLPLAIELAARRTKLLSPEQMLPRLQQRLSAITSTSRTVPQRQRTLRDAIAWSYELLDGAERRLFARLSAFSGGWTLDAAEAVCRPEDLGIDVLDGLASLVDKSLIRGGEGAREDPRFSMLETIREFAQERLADDPAGDEILELHAAAFLEFAAEAEPHLTASDQGEWLDRCDEEHANIRAALRWAIDAGEAERAQTSAGALWRFWQQRGHLAEGRRWLDEVLALPAPRSGRAARAKALTGAGGIAWWQNDHAAARTFYHEALSIERELGDPVRLAESLYNDAFVVAAAGDLEAAAGLLDESLDLFRRAGDERGVARALVMLVIRDATHGDWAAVIERIEEVVGIWRALGDLLNLAFDLVWLAFSYGRAGRPVEAWDAALEALDLFVAADNPTGTSLALLDLAFLANWEGRHPDALRLAAASAALRDRAGGGPPPGFAGLLEGDPAAEARARLSDDEADEAWGQGLAMSEAEASTLAHAGGQSADG
jgi:predicted ATPase/class 3 adenylate cyclase